MQLHKKIFIVALVLSICISIYFLINPSNILNFPILVSEFDDITFKYYMFVKIGIVLLFIKFLLDICLEYIKNWFKKF
jgi:ABC-type phosphate transport system permease subunit